MMIRGPANEVAAQCERVLRTLPAWFGRESALMMYAQNTTELPTFIAEDEGQIVGFLSLRQHYPSTWEVDCMAIEASHRNRGVGQTLHAHAQDWLVTQGVQVLQVKTLAETHPSLEYASTREFYKRIGYLPLEEFTTLWDATTPCLVMVKPLCDRHLMNAHMDHN